jgi:hypothetical protein
MKKEKRLNNTIEKIILNIQMIFQKKKKCGVEKIERNFLKLFKQMRS